MRVKTRDLRKGVRLIYAQLENERRKRGMTQKELAKICGMSQQMLSFMETGRSDVSVRTLIAMSDFFECDVVLMKKI